MEAVLLEKHIYRHIDMLMLRGEKEHIKCNEKERNG
jgi:hypothetical protein